MNRFSSAFSLRHFGQVLAHQRSKPLLCFFDQMQKLMNDDVLDSGDRRFGKLQVEIPQAISRLRNQLCFRSVARHSITGRKSSPLGEAFKVDDPLALPAEAGGLQSR